MPVGCPNPARHSNKFLYLLVLTLLLVALLPVSGVASMGHNCSNCHTMHNSQEGAAVNADGPAGNLLVSGCVGCHSNTGSETIKTIGSSRVPVVYNTSEPASPLAGGNFYWVAQGHAYDAYGHNVVALSGQDSRFSYAPGGGGHAGQMSCSLQDKDGVTGNCHVAIPTCRGCHAPKHHSADKADPNQYALVTGGGYYRFLGEVNDSLAAGYQYHASTGFVQGGEDPDWEQNPSATAHNEYPGDSGGSGCIGCHGQMHGDQGPKSISQRGCGCHSGFFLLARSSGRWVRHPIDYPLPNSGEYANYTTYDPLAPICRPDIGSFASASSVVRPGTDLLMCLSCHRAHGSPYKSMLRWEYQSTDVGPTGTCRTCHTQK